MKLFYTLLFLPLTCFAYDEDEQAQMMVCGVIAEDLSKAPTMKDLEPNVFFDAYYETLGEIDENNKQYLYNTASIAVSKTQTEFSDLNPVGERRDPVYKLMNTILDSSFHAWGFYSCEGLYWRLNSGE